MYKTSFINCDIDSSTTQMVDVDVFVRKYAIDYTPTCCALSNDGRLVVLGCGNYLIVLSADSGKEIKRI